MILEYVLKKNQVVVRDKDRVVAWAVSTVYDREPLVRYVSALRNLLTVVESTMSEREWRSVRRSWHRQWKAAWRGLDHAEISPTIVSELRTCYYWARENMPYERDRRRKPRVPDEKPNVWSLLRHNRVDSED